MGEEGGDGMGEEGELVTASAVEDLGETVSVREAQGLLGIAERGVRRTIKEGRVRAALGRGPGGKEWRIARADVLRLAGERGAIEGARAPEVAADGRELVAALDAAVGPLAGAVAALRTHIDERAFAVVRENEGLRLRVVALEREVARLRARGLLARVRNT